MYYMYILLFIAMNEINKRKVVVDKGRECWNISFADSSL